MVVYNGTYRGIVIDTYDPAGMNRIRVQVPQVLGSATSGWAYPAWSIHDMSIWPEDRFPKPGEGVWIRFESPDRMNWIGTFGLTEPAGADPANAFDVTIEWSIPWLVYNTPTVVTGFVKTPSGTPNPEPIVTLMQNNGAKDVNGNWVWVEVARGPVVQTAGGIDDGAFSLLFSRTIEPVPATLQYMIRFLETGAFLQTDSAIQKTVEPLKNVTVFWDSGDPVWNSYKAISGHVTTGIEGLPTPCRIDLEMRKQGATPWILQGSADVLPDKTWSITHKRLDTSAIEYRAVFTGHSGYFTFAAPVKKYGVVSSVPSLTWDLPGKPMYVGTPIAINGTLNSEYGVPVPATVNFQTQSGATWTTRVSATANSLGNWSMTYTPEASTTFYRMAYPGASVWQATNTSPPLERTATFGTSVSISALTATMVHGSGLSVSGSVTDVASRPVTRGTAELWYRLTIGGDTAWHATGAGAVGMSGSGTFAITHPALDFVGPIEWKVKYLGDGGSFLASESSAHARNVGLNAVGAITKGALGVSTASISWPAVSGATNYRIWRNGSNIVNVTSASFGDSGLAADTGYSYKVDAFRADYAGVSNIIGGESGTVTCVMGHNAVTKNSSFSNRAINCTDSDSYRPDVGWGYIGSDVAQGYWSNSDSRYAGVMSYDVAGFKSWVVSTYGQDVWDNLTFTDCKITMKRTSSGGDNAANKIYWYHVNVTPGGSGTMDLYNVEETPGAAWNGTVTCSLPGAWIDNLLKSKASGTIATVKAIAIYKNAAGAAYQTYKGYSTTGACDMTVSASWNFTSVAAAGSYWQ